MDNGCRETVWKFSKLLDAVTIENDKDSIKLLEIENINSIYHDAVFRQKCLKKLAGLDSHSSLNELEDFKSQTEQFAYLLLAAEIVEKAGSFDLPEMISKPNHPAWEQLCEALDSVFD